MNIKYDTHRYILTTAENFSAGDHLKILFPAAYTQTMLCLTGLMFPKGYEAARAMVPLGRTIVWGAKYLVKGHVKKADREMIFQVNE